MKAVGGVGPWRTEAASARAEENLVLIVIINEKVDQGLVRRDADGAGGAEQ